MEGRRASGGLFCAFRGHDLKIVPLWNCPAKPGLAASRNGQQIVTIAGMDTRIMFGRKNVGHPFRTGLAPQILAPALFAQPQGDEADVYGAEPRSHAFRAALPEAVLRVMPAYEPEVAIAMERAKLRSKPLDPARITLQDVKDFLLAYCACFLAVLAFIS